MLNLKNDNNKNVFTRLRIHLFIGILATLSFVISISVVIAMAAPKETLPGVSSNGAPIIGVLTQVLRDYKRFVQDRHLHLASSYVKWIESAGGQVVPILLNKDDDYYEKMFNITNGLLFPGGDNLLDPHKDTPMMHAAKKLYKLAVEANDRGDFYPIWGTCLGFELLSVLTANRNVLTECSANDLSLKMEFTAKGKLFQPSSYAGIDLGNDFAAAMVDKLSKENITYNFHHKCITDEDLGEAGLNKFYRPLAYSTDKNNLRFIAIFEAIRYPFFGVQFHPEKAPFEYVVKKSQQRIPHSRLAIAASRYFADYFMALASKNNHTKPERRELERVAIYSYNALYTAPMNDMYEQRYLFPYQDNGLTTEEFVDRHLSDHEDVPEEVTVQKQIRSPKNWTDYVRRLGSNQMLSDRSVQLKKRFKIFT